MMFDGSLGEKRPHIALQLHCYSLMMNRGAIDNIIKGTSFLPCIYSLRSIFKKDPETYQIAPEKLDDFEKELCTTIDQIFNPNLPFEPGPQTEGDPEHSVCKFCDFKKLCNKE